MDKEIDIAKTLKRFQKRRAICAPVAVELMYI